MNIRNILSLLSIIVLFTSCGEEKIDGPVGRADYFIQNESSVSLIYKDQVVYSGPQIDLVIPPGSTIKIGDAADFGTSPPLPSSGLIPMILYLEDNNEEKVAYQQDPINNDLWAVEVIEQRSSSTYGWSNFTLTIRDTDLNN